MGDLYNEKSGIIDNEVDLTSEAFQIWKNATDRNPELKKIVESLDNVSYSTRSRTSEATKPEGVGNVSHLLESLRGLK